MVDHPKIPAEIIEVPVRDNGYFYIIKDEQGQTYNLRGLGAPMGGKVGDKGFVQYTRHAMGAWHFWSKV